MSNAKVVMGQAANTLVKPLDVEDVFSTYLYEGNGSTQTITNGIDLDGEGGLVWIKDRNASDHGLFDTERGKDYRLRSNTTNSQTLNSGWVTSFNNNGFGVGSSNSSNGSDYASWTFRKAPKFFTCVEYTGDNTGDRVLSHNVGTVGAVFVKNLTSGDNYSGNWCVHHRSLGTGQSSFLNLNSNAAPGSGTGTNPVFSSTDTTVTIRGGGIGELNEGGVDYVAYIFAHNDGDGKFGPDGDADIIKCGTFTMGSQGSVPVEVNLGWEPQWVLYKSISRTNEWRIIDNMRGWSSGGDDYKLVPNAANAEEAEEFNGGEPTSTGFKVATGSYGETCAYIAIRRGTKVPESASEVFAMDVGDSDGDSSTPEFVSGFPVDAGLVKQTNGTGQFFLLNRLNQGATLYTDSNQAENTSGVFAFDYSDGFYGGSRNADYQAWMWKRAPGYFDVVAYSGDGVSGRTVSHNLGVAPDMIWAKQRSSSGNSWRVWYSGIPSGKSLRINGTDALFNETSRISDAGSTTFTLNDGTSGVNASGSTYIAYLFASLPGISKVGSYTGNGTSQTIDCGFTSGARFVLIKRTDSTGSWQVFDTERGIVSGNDPRLFLESTSAELSTRDILDPDPSGFSLTSDTSANTSGASYIFYAIA